MKKMIPFDQALSLVLSSKLKVKTRRMPLLVSHGFVAAEDILALVDSPPFHQSAMDGYALRYKLETKAYALPDSLLDIPAGKLHAQQLKPGQAIRIFTGARIPDKADTVVAQEQVEVDNGFIRISDKDFRKGKNVRPKGSHFRKGAVLVSKGTRLNSGAVALLAQSGITHVVTAKPPRVGVLVTGDELISAGKPLTGAGIYESNSATLLAFLASCGITEVETCFVPDQSAQIRKGINTLLRRADVVLVTGGVSVGDYDLVPSSLEAAGVDVLFHKIRQKPGKPVLFGRKGHRFVFGLPGNPGSVISCFHTLVVPLLHKMVGKKPSPLIQGKLKSDVKVKPGLTHFLKAHLENGVVEILDGQESYKVEAYVKSNVLVMIPEEKGAIASGEQVACIPVLQ